MAASPAGMPLAGHLGSQSWGGSCRANLILGGVPSNARKFSGELRLSQEEVAFYDALETNDSAVAVLSDDQAILGCMLGEDWTSPRILEMRITIDGHLLGRSEGQPEFSALLGASEDHLRNTHGVAKVAKLDGDQLGYLIAKVGEVKQQPK
jgi:hypothetical protein